MGIFTKAFDTLKTNPMLLLPSVAINLFSYIFRVLRPPYGGAYILLSFFVAILFFIGAVFISGFYAFAGSQAYSGKKTRLIEGIEATKPKLWNLIKATLVLVVLIVLIFLTAIGVFGAILGFKLSILYAALSATSGTFAASNIIQNLLSLGLSTLGVILLLIIVVLILVVLIYLTNPVIVLENTGAIASIKRSIEIGKNNFGDLALVVFIAALISGVAQLIASLILASIPGSYLLTSLVSGCITAWTYLIPVGYYMERVKKTKMAS